MQIHKFSVIFQEIEIQIHKSKIQVPKSKIQTVVWHSAKHMSQAELAGFRSWKLEMD